MPTFPRISGREETALRRDDPQPMAVHPGRMSLILDSDYSLCGVEMLLPPEEKVEEDHASRSKFYICTPARSKFQLKLETVG
jgi:hypothetical protein